ncbi:hypothetical protein BKA80DRAFT_271371 [Phyllosticta citrichinensis]
MGASLLASRSAAAAGRWLASPGHDAGLFRHRPGCPLPEPPLTSRTLETVDVQAARSCMMAIRFWRLFVARPPSLKSGLSPCRLG